MASPPRHGLLPNDPVLLDYRIRQNFFGQPLDSFAGAFELNIEDLSLPDVGYIGKSNRTQAAMNRHSLGIENRRFQRHYDSSFHFKRIPSGRFGLRSRAAARNRRPCQYR